MNNIKYLVMDIDGSLTDGKIYMGNGGESVKAFSIKDGYAINFILKPAGIESIVITGRTSKIVENRCREIGIEEVYQGKVEKFSALKEAVLDSMASCAYFGDDVLDLVCMKPIKEAGGLVGCPADAVKEVKALADYICINKAGEGAFREFSEWLVIDHPNEAEIERRVRDAIDYIAGMEKAKLLPGKYEVNDDFYYSVQEYATKPVEHCKLESHRRYIDIQWIVGGEEEIDVADISGLEQVEEYDDQKDIMHWKPRKNMEKAVLRKDSYIVLYPKDAHMGCIKIRESSNVKKIVGKVRID